MTAWRFPTLEQLPENATISFAPHVNVASLPRDAHIVVLPPYLATFTLTGPAADTLSSDERVAILSCLEAHRGSRALRLSHALLALVDEPGFPADVFRAVFLSFLRAWSNRRPSELLLALFNSLQALAKTQHQAATLRLLLRQLNESFEYDAYQEVAPAVKTYFTVLDGHTNRTDATLDRGALQEYQDSGPEELDPDPARTALLAIAPATQLLNSEQIEEVLEALAHVTPRQALAYGIAFATVVPYVSLEPERADAIKYATLAALCSLCVLQTGHPALRACATALRALTRGTQLQRFLAPFAKGLSMPPIVAHD